MTKLLLAISVAIATPALYCAEITVSGYTNGCFGAACVPPNTSASQSTALLGLSYQNSTFGPDTTAGGFVAFGGNATPIGTQDTENLGSMFLAATANTYTGQSFTLRVTFTLPTTITGGNTSTYTATLNGAVAADNSGGVFVDFNNTPQTFTFTNGTTNGSFNFSVNDLSINPNQLTNVSGQITAGTQSSVPEPATAGLWGFGLVMLGAVGSLRRRKV